MDGNSYNEVADATIDLRTALLTPLSEQHCVDARTPKHTKRCTWVQTTTALLSLQLGWGLWLFPACFAAMGWIPSLAVTLGLALATVYSGTLFSRLYQCVPQAVIFGDIAHQAAGQKGRTIVYFIFYLLNATRCVVMHLAATQSLQHTLGNSGRSLWQCGLAVLLLAVVLSQIRALSRLSCFFLTGTTAQLLAIGIVVYDLLRHPIHAAETELVQRHGQFDRQLVAFFNVVFAYGGQFAYTELMTDMRKAHDFPKAICVCTSIMTSLYVGLGAAGYWAKGGTLVADVVIFSLKHGPLAQTAAACILVQALAQYLVNINVWSHNLLILIGRATGSSRSATARSASEHSPWRWLLISFLVVTYSWLVAMCLPYFSTLVGVIASLTYLVCAYTLPCWLALRLFGRKMWKGERWWCCWLIPVSLLVSGAGLFGSVRALLGDIHEHGLRYQGAIAVTMSFQLGPH